jgi:hypothetical protein
VVAVLADDGCSYIYILSVLLYISTAACVVADWQMMAAINNFQ